MYISFQKVLKILGLGLEDRSKERAVFLVQGEASRTRSRLSRPRSCPLAPALFVPCGWPGLSLWLPERLFSPLVHQKAESPVRAKALTLPEVWKCCQHSGHARGNCEGILWTWVCS